MSCPYFREGYFGICVAPDAVHVPNIQELESFCFRTWYTRCPSLAGPGEFMHEEAVRPSGADNTSAVKRMAPS
ncbi:MAG: hypothetical protein M0Z60_14720 [Nitrospiraceae bacterium]|nr:hypothetical protein [Nitrospiraceae bacterium]